MSARRPATLGALVLATVAFAHARQTPPAASASSSRLSHFPRLVLWAWERPEDLRWIDPARVGVAFLDRTLHLEKDRTRLEPRRQPLRVGPQTRLMAVGRTAADRTARDEELSALENVGGHTNYFAPIVLRRARTHPEDPDVPEALARIVRGARYGDCRDEDAVRYARGAFQLLHRRYPRSIWAKQTPYWYR